MVNHYLIQDLVEFNAPNFSGGKWHVGGNVCGAVCTLYLMREYLCNVSGGDGAVDNRWEADHFVSCWQEIKTGTSNFWDITEDTFSNPFKIIKSLQNKGLSAEAIVFEDNKVNNPLYGLLAYNLKDAGYTEGAQDCPQILVNEGNFTTYEYFLGVFKEAASQAKSAAKYHYILLQKVGDGYMFINPHLCEWENAGNIIDSEGKFAGGFCLADGNNKIWQWMNFGLGVKKVNDDFVSKLKEWK